MRTPRPLPIRIITRPGDGPETSLLFADLHGLVDAHVPGRAGIFSRIGSGDGEPRIAYAGTIGERPTRRFLHRNVAIRNEIADIHVFAVAGETPPLGVGHCDKIVLHPDDIDGGTRIGRTTTRRRRRSNLLLVDVETDSENDQQSNKTQRSSHSVRLAVFDRRASDLREYTCWQRH